MNPTGIIEDDDLAEPPLQAATKEDPEYSLALAMNYGQSTGSPHLLRFITEHTEIFLARREQVGDDNTRSILFIGDGSLQMSVQEISTIIRENLNVIVFIINNSGYTIERAIHGRKQGYDGIASWRHTHALVFFLVPVKMTPQIPSALRPTKSCRAYSTMTEFAIHVE